MEIERKMSKKVKNMPTGSFGASVDEVGLIVWGWMWYNVGNRADR